MGTNNPLWTNTVTMATGTVVTADDWNEQIGQNIQAVSRALWYEPAGTVALNTASTVTLLTGTVPAGALSASRMLGMTLAGDYVWNAAGTAYLGILWNGSTIATEAWSAQTPGPTSHPWEITVNIANRGTANSQYLWGKLLTNSSNWATGGATKGGFLIADNNDASIQGGVIGGTPAIDTTVAGTVSVLFNWGAASTALSWSSIYGVAVLT